MLIVSSLYILLSYVIAVRKRTFKPTFFFFNIFCEKRTSFYNVHHPISYPLRFFIQKNPNCELWSKQSGLIRTYMKFIYLHIEIKVWINSVRLNPATQPVLFYLSLTYSPVSYQLLTQHTTQFIIKCLLASMYLRPLQMLLHLK